MQSSKYVYLIQEKERREHEEYLKMKAAFAVEEEGFDQVTNAFSGIFFADKDKRGLIKSIIPSQNRVGVPVISV